MPYNFVPEDDLYSFKCNQHVLVQKEFIKFVRGFDHVTEDKYVPPDLTEAYPLVNSIYEYAEDYDAVNRIPHLLYERLLAESSEEPSGASTSTFEIGSEETLRSSFIQSLPRKNDHIQERCAQIDYLETKPKSFLILGKPGLGQERLGKLLADYWRCVLISPEALIQEEIRSGSRAGLCIEFNLRCGRAISVDVIMRLLEQRLACASVRHRGFALCGFPLIANDLYSEDPVSSESAIFTAKEIFDDLIDSVVPKDTVRHVSRTSVNLDEAEGDEFELPGEGAFHKRSVLMKETVEVYQIRDYEPICYQSKEYDSSTNQMDFIMSLCGDHDYCMVYLKCGNEEVENIRGSNRYDSKTLQQTSLQRERAENTYYTLFNLFPNDEDNLALSYEEAGNRRTLKVPNDCAPHVRVQLERYFLETQLVIEKHILMTNPQDIIRLDGRMSAHRLFQVLRMRLKVLPFTPAIIPELVAPPAVSFNEPGEDGVASLKESASSIIKEVATDEIYLRLRSRKALGPLYNWNLSEWKFQCPVAMREGHPEVGYEQYAVHFMNKVFFLSNEERLERFLENPRPYLLPPMPLTIKKFFIMGPPHSGKTALAKCLQNLNGAEVIDYHSVKLKYVRHKFHQTLARAKRDAIREALEYWKNKRKQAYLAQESNRMKRVAMYLKCIEKSLNEVLQSLVTLNEFTAVAFSPLPAFSEKEKSEREISAENTLERLANFRALLGLESPDDCRRYLENKELMIGHLPDELQEPTVFKYWTVIGPDSACVVEYANRLLRKAEEELMSGRRGVSENAHCLNAVLADFNDLMERGKIHGWILDGMPPSQEVLELVDKKYAPDLTYIITDSTHGETLLRNDLEGIRIDNTDWSNLYKEANISTDNLTMMKTKSHPSMGDFGLDRSSHDLMAEINSYLIEQVPGVEAALHQMEYPFKKIDVGGISFLKVLANFIDEYALLKNAVARVVTQEEKALEPSHYGDFGDLIGEYPGEDMEPNLDALNSFLDNRRLGNTALYDPVVFSVHGALWMGKEDFLVNYLNKMWLFATEANMKLFIDAPQKYAKHILDNQKLPPPRICVVGNKKVGKTTQACLLCKWLGLYYFGFDEELKKRTEEGHSDDGEQDAIDDTSLKEMILPFWHNPNKKAIGFVLDGFPRNVDDLSFMLENFLIPDCIIELHVDPMALNARLVDILLAEWRIQIGTEKELERTNHEKELDNWQANRDLDKARMLAERHEDRYSRKLYGEDVIFSETESLLSYKSYQEAQDENAVEAILQEKFPPPVLIDNWETEDKARERLKQAVDETTTVDPIDLNLLREATDIEKINWHIIDGNMDQTRVYNLIMQYIMKYLFRNGSFFERAYDISIEMAERLLEHGYYFLSRFGKTCPVQMYKNHNPLQMYIPKETQFQLFPMIYSNYIYFIAGGKNRDLFRKDILKYINQDYTPLPLIRARIAVIGPPRCGKTSVAERLASEYSFEHISIGRAVRRVLKYMPSSILAKKVNECLRRGDELTDDLTMQCAEAMTFEAKAVALGYVMDGLPNSISEVQILAQMNLVPHLVVDLSASLEYVFRYMDVFDPTHRPEYSKKFIKYRYDDWAIDKDDFRQWLDREYQNMATISVEPSRWKTWSSANELMLAVINEIKHYYRNCDKDVALRVANMLVSPYEFLIRQSEFKSYCPLCLYYDNCLYCGGIPPDRTGLLVYHDKFYWLCKDHINEFEDDPEKFLGPNVRHSLPAQLPIVVSNLTEVPENVFLCGYCVACLAQSMPDRIFKMGELANAISFGERIYLFDTSRCMTAFMKTPNMAQNVPYELPTSTFPPCDIEHLPTLGMLEQYLSSQIIKALIEVEKARPLIPGLDIEQSAVVCLGLLLKINNPNTPERHVQLYKEVKRKTMDAQLVLKQMIEDAKNTINPYLHYQEPLPPFKLDLACVNKEATDLTYIKEIIDSMLDRIEYGEHVGEEDTAESRQQPDD